MIKITILIIFILFFLYIVSSNSLYIKLCQTDIDDILSSYNDLPFLNSSKTVVVIKNSDLQDKTLESCIKSIFNQKYKINNLYILTNDTDIPEYIKKTSVVVNSMDDVYLIESDKNTHIVELEKQQILNHDDFVNLCELKI